jgi:hypothetical protein
MRVRFAAQIRSQRGASFVGVLAALLIGALLYFGYFKMQDSGAEHSKGIAAIDASKEVACRTQRQNIERDIMMWKASHDGEPSLSALRADGIRIPSCPEGGRYDIVHGSVRCSKHGG